MDRAYGSQKILKCSRSISKLIDMARRPRPFNLTTFDVPFLDVETFPLIKSYSSFFAVPNSCAVLSRVFRRVRAGRDFSIIITWFLLCTLAGSPQEFSYLLQEDRKGKICALKRICSTVIFLALWIQVDGEGQCSLLGYAKGAGKRGSATIIEQKV